MAIAQIAKIYDYRYRFSSEYMVSGFNNSVLVNRYQPYAGGAGPIYLSNADIVNGIIRLGTSDLIEDIKFTRRIQDLHQPQRQRLLCISSRI